MNVNVHFAKPVEIYDNFLNKCAGRYCHTEVSVQLDSGLLAVIIDSCIEEAYDPKELESLLKRVKNKKGVLQFCFYILWNDKVSVRFYNDMADDNFNNYPTEDVYDTVTLEIEGIETLKNFISFYLKQINKPYDIVRALLLFSPVTMRLNQEPSRWFCSQLVMHSLKHLGMECNNDINHMKPDDVYDWLTGSIKALENN